MSDTENKTLEAIGKILSLTREGIINWSVANRKNIIVNDGDNITIAFKGEYLGKSLRIYEKKYEKQVQKKNFGSLTYTMSLLHDSSRKDEYITKQYTITILEIIDINENSLWAFPQEDILSDLLKAIKYKSSGAQEFINEILQDENFPF
ncbi:MAG: hypothetical protein Q8S36_10705 [Sulfuricurvum sp.]|nr:hypothetical protein [Sulfuricurvum sp.]